MCGIVGSTNPSALIQEALSRIGHRGPDGTGIFSDAVVSLAHARLSIIDLSSAGNQPMVSGDSDVVISYNGELYNYQALRAELVRTGSQFKTKSDTEVVLEGYRSEGVSFFEKMRGMWAFAIYDKRDGTVVLSRDRFGIKSLYYSLENNSLTFASEMKAFRHLGIKEEPNTEGFYSFFALGYFIAPETCYRGIYVVEPGETITYNSKTGDITRTKVSSHAERVETKTEKEVVDGLEEVLLDSVRAHYVADVPVGLLFSGGTDSSLIAALSLRAGFKPQAYHLAVSGTSDTAFAEDIAQHLGLLSETISMGTDELVKQYEEIWTVLDVPFADLSVIPTSLIYKKIAGRSKVVLSGEGGDELFGGYLRHRALSCLSKVKKEDAFVRAIESMYGRKPRDFTMRNPLLSRIRNTYFKHLGDDVIGSYLKETKLIDYPFDREKVRAKLFALHEAEAKGGVPANLFFDQKMYLPNDLLFKNDIASMASSIEARVPFLDREVEKYAAAIPSELRLSQNYTGKRLLKSVLERYLPQELVHRDKRGFGFSFERYHIPEFRADVEKALMFHFEHADTFGLPKYRKLFTKAHADIFIKKYPRFAFGLVSNWKIFKK